MNVDRRKRLSVAASKISEVKDLLAEIKDEEEMAMENVPESLQETERYQAMELACDVIEEAVEACDDLVDSLQEIEGVSVA